MSETHVELRRKVKVRDVGDTRLYVRVQQEDGHRAWSSPIYRSGLNRFGPTDKHQAPPLRVGN